jgi:2-C-methyl-D-erythritol 4-phosphate cytidylyltransferase
MPSFSVIVLTAPPPGVPAGWIGAYVKIDGREAVLRSVELFLNRDEVPQIQLVVTPAMIADARQKYGHHLGFSGVKLVTGGPGWIDQIAAAAPTVSPDATHVVIHDAARPAVPYTDVAAILETVTGRPVVAMVSPVTAPLLEIDEGGTPVARHHVSSFVHLLSPIAFDRKTFDEIVKTRAVLHPSRIFPLTGSPLNQRVNTPADAGMVKTMLGMLPKKKVQSASPFDEAQW